MIELTSAQRQELSESEPLVIDPETKETYVLVRKEAYERLKAFFAADTVFTTAEMLDKVMAEDDLGDPWLEQLQKQYGNQHI